MSMVDCYVSAGGGGGGFHIDSHFRFERFPKWSQLVLFPPAVTLDSDDSYNSFICLKAQVVFISSITFYFLSQAL